jgi:hypothetical protein
MNSNNAMNRFKDGFDSFKSNKNVAAANDFLQSNSIIAKFSFLLLVLLLFVVALRLGTTLLSKLFSPNPNPILINGMIDAKQFIKIPQDPSVSGSIPIMRSQNSENGLVFTWSVWIFIDDITYRQNEYRHIFHKGNDNVNVTKVPIGMNHPNNAPGLYIAPDTNALIVIMNTFENINEEVIVPDIPLNKWLNVIIRVDEQHKLDIYINGMMIRRHIMKSVPRQNYGDVFVSMNGGFSGYTSCLRYFNSAIGVNQIQSIVDKGPSLNMLGNTSMSSNASSRYLSLKWFFAGNNDMYNP